MSINAISDIMRCGPVFKNAEKGVALAFANYVDQNGMCHPSIEEVAWVTGLHRRTVQRTVPDLEDLGILEIIEQGGGRRANRYRLNIEWLEKAAAAIYRTKQKALQDGHDRYKVMAKVAENLRSELERERDADPIRGPRYRERYGVRGGERPPLRGGATPPLTKTKKFAEESGATSGVASCPVVAASDHPSSGVTPPEPSIEPFINPSVDPPPAASAQPQGAGVSSDIEEDAEGLRKVEQDKPLLRSRLQACDAARVDWNGFKEKAGGQEAADLLVLRHASGKLTDQQLRARLADSEAVSGTDQDSGPMVLAIAAGGQCG